jgi:antitoxin component YwqK of YwqJK toxin-antitoxin module
MLNAEFHGKQIEYHENGQLAWIAKYKKGQVIDTAFNYYPSGKLEATYTKNWDVLVFENGDTMAILHKKNDHPVGQRRMYFSGQRPKRFITYNDSGEKHGWEVFWYENGNVKDSTLYNNGDITKGTSFYLNGKFSLIENDLQGDRLLSATSYNPQGKKTGEVNNGTGTIFVCDSLGGDCHELQFKDGKQVFK